MKTWRQRLMLLCLPVMLAISSQAQTASIVAQPIASNLNNPRGVVALEDGRLLVVEAGTGTDDPYEPDEAPRTGRILLMEDTNSDGDYDDEGERTPLLDGHPSYNSLGLFRTGHDEPFGLSDLVRLSDGRIFFTLDDPFYEYSRNEQAFYGNTGIYEVTPLTETGATRLAKRITTLNAFVYDPQRDLFFVTESGGNRLISIDLNGEANVIVNMPLLNSGQQPVPSGIALDPQTGEVLVALFSGFVNDYYGEVLSFMPGDSRIVRVDPDSGTIQDDITGLTTGIDVAVDAAGNRYVVELTTAWATPLMPYDFNLTDPESPPDPGGYQRFTGRVSRYPADGSDPVILADGLDAPTNITLAGDSLYVSTGLGTPGRVVLGPEGLYPIDGVIYRITGFSG